MGDFFGGGETQTTTSQVKVDLPSWIQNPLRNVVNDTEALRQQEFNAYTDPRVAGLTADEQNAFAMTRQLTGADGFNVDPSKDITNQVAQRGLNGYTQEQLQPFMNPCIENVLDVGRNRQFDTYDRQMNDYRGRASQAGAFGGSRFGLGEAQMQQDFGRQMQEFETEGLYNAFNDGMGRAQQGTQLAGAASMDLANLQGMQQQGGLQDIAALQSIGSTQRGLNQSNLDANYEEFNRQEAHPYQQLQFASGIYNPVGSLMRGTTQTDTTETEGGGSFLGTALGLGSLALGIPGVGAALGGALGGGALGGALAGAGTGLSAGLSASQVGRMALGGARGMQGPGFAEGGLVTDNGQNYMQKINANFQGQQMPQPVAAPQPLQQSQKDDGGGIDLGMIMSLASAAMGAPTPFAEGGQVNSDPYGGIRPVGLGSASPQHLAMLQRQRQGNGIDPMQILAQTMGGVGAEDGVISEASRPDGGMTEAVRQGLWERGIFGNEQDFMPASEKGNVIEGQSTNVSEGTMDDYLRATSYIESKDDPKAINKNSKAAGRFQFIPSTAKAYGLEDPHDDEQAFKAMTQLTKDNKKVLTKNLKRAPSNAELYLAHQQGATGASKLLANPDKKAKDIVGSKAVTQNGGKKDMTARQFASMWLDKYAQTEAAMKPQAYAEGGQVMSPFQRSLQQGIKNPLLSFKESLTGKAFDTQKSMQELGQYFTQSEEDYYKNDPTALDKMQQGARLNIAGDRLERGQLPTNLQKMMSQVSPLGAATQADITLDPMNNRLMVQQPQQPVAAPVPMTLDQAAATALGKESGEAFKLNTERTLPTTTAPKQEANTAQERNQRDFNLPLMAFGAQLLSSRRGFTQALGDAAQVGIQTKGQVDQRQNDALKEQAQNKLRQRSQELQEMRVNAEMQRLNATLPYQDTLNQLKIQKALKDLSEDGSMKDTQKAVDKLAEVILDTRPGLTSAQAFDEAEKTILSTRIGQNLSQGQQKPTAVSYKDFVPNGNK